MSKRIPFPTHLTEKDLELSDALHIIEADKQHLDSAILSDNSSQDVLVQQMIKQLLVQTTGEGNPLDPNVKVAYFPEDGFIIQERYL